MLISPLSQRNLFSNKLKNQKKHLTHEHPTPDVLSGGSTTGNPSSTVTAHDAALSSSMVSSSSQAAEVASGSLADTSIVADTALLTAFTSHPTQPFVPDFLQTFLALSDILIEVYSKILVLSGFSAANWEEPMHGHQEEARGMAGQLSESLNRMDTKVKVSECRVSQNFDQRTFQRSPLCTLHSLSASCLRSPRNSTASPAKRPRRNSRRLCNMMWLIARCFVRCDTTKASAELHPRLVCLSLSLVSV